ncbi:uncharacterized protein LOC118197496 isoform X2 [Stegodyphus dumicola]|nr:uncharacterized protein LOC118197496 isoform X2 [Stegodyphus dumicola]
MARLRIKAVLENKSSKEMNNVEDYIEILELIRESNVDATSFISRYNTWSSNFHITLENTNSAKENSLKSVHPSYFMRFLATAFFTLCLLESVRCKNQICFDTALTFCIILLIMNFISSFILYFSASPNQLVKTMILFSNAMKTMFSDFKFRLNRAGRKFDFSPRPSALFIVSNFLTPLSLLHWILTPLSSLSEWYLLHGSLFSASISIIFYVLDYETAPERTQIEITACSLLLLLALLQDRKVQNILTEIKLQVTFLESECMDFLLWFEEKCSLKRLLEESGFYKAEMLELFNHETERRSVLEKPLLSFVTFFVAAESCFPAHLHFSNLSNVVSFILYGTCNPNVNSFINIVSVSNKGASDSKTPKIHSLDSSNVPQQETFLEANVPQECSLFQVPLDTHEKPDQKNGNEMFSTFVTSSPEVSLDDELSSTDVKNQFSCSSKNEILNDESGIDESEDYRKIPPVQGNQSFTNNVNLLNSGITFPTNNECEKCVFPKADIFPCTSASNQDDKECKKYEENVLLSNLNSSFSFLQEETLGILNTKNGGISSQSNAGGRIEIDESLKDEQTCQPFVKEITRDTQPLPSHSAANHEDSTDLGDLQISQCKNQAEIKKDSATKYRSEVPVAPDYKLQGQNASQPEDMPGNASIVSEKIQANDSFLLSCSALSQQSEEDIKNSDLVNGGSQVFTVRNGNQSYIVSDEPITNENGQNIETGALNHNEHLQNEETSELQIQHFAVPHESEEYINHSGAVCEGEEFIVEKLQYQLDILKDVLESINGIVDSIIEMQEFTWNDDTFESKMKQSALFRVVETEKYSNISEGGNDYRSYLGTMNGILQKSHTSINESVKHIISETPDRPKVEDFSPDECLQSDEASKLGTSKAGRRQYPIKSVTQAECEETREFESISANVTPNDGIKQELNCDNDLKMKISDNKEILNITLNNESAHLKYNGRTCDSEIKMKDSCHLKHESSTSDVLAFDAVNGDIMRNIEIDGKKALEDGSTTTFSSDNEVDAPSEKKTSDRFTSDENTIDNINPKITENLVSSTVKLCPDDQVNHEIRNQSTISENKAEFDCLVNGMETPDFDESKLNQNEQSSKGQVIQNCVSEDQTSVPVAEVENQMNVLSKSASDFNQETSYKSANSFHKQANSGESVQCNESSFSDFNNQNENNSSRQMRCIMKNFFDNLHTASKETEVNVKHSHALNSELCSYYALIDEFMKRNQKPDISRNTKTYINSGNSKNVHTQEISNKKEHKGMDLRQIRRPFVFGNYVIEQNTDGVLKLDQKYNASVNSSIYVNNNYNGAEHKGGISNRNESDRNGLQHMFRHFNFEQEDEQGNRHRTAPIAAVVATSTNNHGNELKTEISNKNVENNLLKTRPPFVSGQQFKEKKTDEIATNPAVHVSNSNDEERNKQEISNKDENDGVILQQIRPFIFGQEARARKTDAFLKHNQKYNRSTNTALYLNSTNNADEKQQEISHKKENVKVANVSLQTGNKCDSPTEATKKVSKCRKKLKAKRYYKNESISKSEGNFNFGMTDCPLLEDSGRNDEKLSVPHCSMTASLTEEKSDHLLPRKFNETCQNTSQEPDSRSDISDRNAVFELKKTELQVESEKRDTEIQSSRKSSPKKRCRNYYNSATEDDEKDGDKVENKQVPPVPLKETRLERTLILVRNILNASKTRKCTVFQHKVYTPIKDCLLNNRITKNSLIREFNRNENCNVFLRKNTDQKIIESVENVPFCVKNSESSEQVSDKDFANQTSSENAECPTVSRRQGNRRKNKKLPIVCKSVEDTSVTLKNEQVLHSTNPKISTEKEPQCSLVFYSSERVDEFSSSSSLPAGSSEDENFRFHQSTSICSETSEGTSADIQIETSDANYESYSYDLLDAGVSRTPSLDQTYITETGNVCNSPKNAPICVSCNSLLNPSRSSVGAFQSVNLTHITASENEPKCKTRGGHMAWNNELCDSADSNLASESTYPGENEMTSSQSRQNLQSDENPLRYQLKHDSISLEFLDELSEVTLRIVSENDSECVDVKNLLENSKRKLKFNSTENAGELLIPGKKSGHKETAFVDYSCLPFEINNEHISICVDAVGEGQPKMSYNSSSTCHSSSGLSTISDGTDTVLDSNFGENAKLSAAGIGESKNELKQKDNESNHNQCLECVEPQCQINGTSSAPDESCDSCLLPESPIMSHLHTSTESQHQSDKNGKTQQEITDTEKINGEETSWKNSNNSMKDVLQETMIVIAESYQKPMDKEQEQCENELLPSVVDSRKCDLNSHENKSVSKADIQNISEENKIQTEALQDMNQSIENVSEDNMLCKSSENHQHPAGLNAPFASASADFEPSSISSLCSSDLTNRNLCLESEKLKFNFTPKPDSGMLEMKYRHAPGITTLIFKSEKEKLYLKIKDPILP